ncbi:hypothetical protein BJV82DRAFT_118111 [Fennellomyces sp. T-0311]|nr:hypothetical protein BJV82DRAFT_118111 [Fennellomyces sp. T-0311]
MSSITAKALLHFERSRNLDEQERDLFQESVQSLTVQSNHTITNRAPSGRNAVSLTIAQSLDTSLCAHVDSKEYDSAMKIALAMQQCVPRSYCGYQRAAQIHLIRNEVEEAQQAYNQGLDKVSKGNDNALLRKSAEDALDIFDQAAIDLAKNGRFMNAHRIAEWITRLLPRSPTGYLRTGEIFEMQGKYSTAEEVYYRGVSKVVSSAPKSLDSLVQHLVNVKREIKRNPRCDFIMQLPFEIASEILQQLSCYNLLKCMDVSRDWKERILQSSKAWRVTILNMKEDKLDMATIQRIKLFVQKFVLINIPENSHSMDDLLTTIADNEFKNLVDIGKRNTRVH